MLPFYESHKHPCAIRWGEMDLQKKNEVDALKERAKRNVRFQQGKEKTKINRLMFYLS